MRLALVTALGICLVLGPAAAQENQRLIDLSNKLAASAESLKLQQTALPGKPKKIGERILKNLLTDGAEERARQDPVFDRFHESAAELASVSRDLGREDADVADERAFIRQFRETERLAMDADRALTDSGARKIMIGEVKPALRDIKREIRSLTAYRDDERREFYRRDRDRL